MHSPSGNRRGILAMLAAMMLFTANDTLVKLITDNLPPGQIMVIRGFFGLGFALVLLQSMGHGRDLKSVFSPLVVLRGALEALLTFTFITALAHLPLANITAILQATPLIMGLITLVLGLEVVGWRRMSAIVVGFVGVLLIVKPSPTSFDAYAGLALVSATLMAARDLVTRSIAGHISTIVVTIAATFAVMLIGGLLSLSETWQPVGPRELATLAAAAGFVTLGNLSIIQAFRVGEIAVISPFRYAVVLSSLLVGYLVFGDWPDTFSFLGIASIVASGLYTIHRERIRRREAREVPAVQAPEAAPALTARTSKT